MIMLQDDFLDTLKNVGGRLWDTGKQFVADNKPHIQKFITNALEKWGVPAPVTDAVWTAFGGSM
jgi:ABC-type branched-subunit amino acid transport system substrate-binding protein